MSLFDDVPNNIDDMKQARDRVRELDERVESISGGSKVLVCPFCFNKLRDSEEGDYWSCEGTGRNYTFLGLTEICGIDTKYGYLMDMGSRSVERVKKYGQE